MPGTTSVANGRCPNCQCHPVGRFCPDCGQRQLPREQYSIRHLLGELLGNLLQWDGKLLATLSLALRKPGELSAHYLAGMRARYSSPVTLLLLVFFVFFLSPQLTDFTQPLADHLNWGQWYAAPLQSNLDALAASHGGQAQLAAAFAHVQADIAKTMVLLHVPLFALVLLALHWRQRLYYAEHVVVASHTVATMMLMFFLALLLVLIPVQWAYELAGQPELPLATKSIVIWLAVKLPLLWLLYAVLKNAYRQPWYWAVAKMPLAVFGFGAVHMLYRALTFWLTIALL